MVMVTIFEIMQEAVERDASDIFITVGVPPTFKIHGVLKPMEDSHNLTPADTEDYSRQLFIKEKDLHAFLDQGESKFSLVLPENGRVRVNIFTQRGYIAV